jgi:hypothetical protein
VGEEKELQSNISNLPMGVDAFGALSVTLQIIKFKVSGYL